MNNFCTSVCANKDREENIISKSSGSCLGELCSTIIVVLKHWTYAGVMKTLKSILVLFTEIVITVNNCNIIS